MVGDYVVRFEHRSLDAIRALGTNDIEDERCFAAVARLSEINLGLYRTFLQPWVRAAVTPERATGKRRLSPSRLQYELISDQNPLLAELRTLAERVRELRQPVAADNPFLAGQEMWSRQIVAALDAYRDLRDAARRGRVLCLLRLAPGAGDAGAARVGGAAPAAARAASPRSWRSSASRPRRCGRGWRGRAARGVHPGAHLHPPAAARGRRAQLQHAAAVRDEYARDMSLADFKSKFRDQYMMVLLDPTRRCGAAGAGGQVGTSGRSAGDAEGGGDHRR